MVGRETVEYFYGNIKAQESAKISPLQEQTLTSMCKASSERDCGTELCHPPLRQDKTRNSWEQWRGPQAANNLCGLPEICSGISEMHVLILPYTSADK